MGVLFPSQARDWALPAEVPLTPRAAERVAREGAVQSFDRAAAALTMDWGLPLEGKQVQRWAEALGQQVRAARAAEVQAYEQGQRPAGPANAPVLLVIGLDGGRVQTNAVNPQTGSRWREDKVAAITSYLPGGGTPENPPRPLVTTYVATMEKAEGFGKLVQVEAERRGLRRAGTVLVVGDGGNWIDPLTRREALCDQRIVDFYHAAEHLYAAARAVWGPENPKAGRQGARWRGWLWAGQFDRLLATLGAYAARLGPPRAEDGPEAPPRVLANTVAYFRLHRPHMDYPRYRQQGWPIGSGVTEAGVKQFNRRVKGTDQFWSEASGSDLGPARPVAIPR